MRTETSVYDFETDWHDTQFSKELKYASQVGVQLDYAETDGHARQGVLDSPWIAPNCRVNEVIVSWNFDLPLGTGALVEVRLGMQDGKTATSWYEMGHVGRIPVRPVPIKKDAQGYVDIDTLVLNEMWDQVQYRVTLFSELPHHTPTLRLIAVCASNTRTNIPCTLYKKNGKQEPWMRSLPVRWRAQVTEDPCIAMDICGPTSLAQALEYWGCCIPTPDVAAEAFDYAHRIFGNWPYLAQTAAQHGLKAWVMCCQDFTPLENEIAAGHPVILSLKFAKGELTNAPIEATKGHLVLCVGMNSDGDLLINDSASDKPIYSHIVYKRDEMATAWLNNKGGAMICIAPRQGSAPTVRKEHS